MRSSLLCTLLCTALLNACHVDKAPATVDEAVRQLWSEYERSDTDVAAFAKNVHTLLKGDRHKVDPLRGRVSELEAAALETVMASAKNASRAEGIYLYDYLNCHVEDVARIATAPNQKELFPNLYDDYTREYFADRDAFLSGAMNRLQYQTTMKASVLGTSYTSVSPVEARRVPLLEGTSVPAGTMLMLRQFIAAPADFRGDGEFRQDYQIELFYPLPEGGVMHLYGIWREMRVGVFTVEDDVTVALILDGLYGYDRTMEKHCNE